MEGPILEQNNWSGAFGNALSPAADDEDCYISDPNIPAQSYRPIHRDTSNPLEGSISHRVPEPQRPFLLPESPLLIPFYEMAIPISLPTPLQGPTFRSYSGLDPEVAPTVHQLLLVLASLFIRNIQSIDDNKRFEIINRHDYEWERCFALRLDGLQSWLRSLRKALTQSRHIYAPSLNDIKYQIQYILFNIGIFAMPGSNISFMTFQRPSPPYRPFGVAASIALVCCAFDCIAVEDLFNFETNEVWLIDAEALSTMTSEISQSPLFAEGASIFQLESMICTLQRAFQVEEARVAFIMPQTICLDRERDLMRYFRRAFLSLDPVLLPSLATLLLGATPKPPMDVKHLASCLAKLFLESSSIETLERTFKSIKQIKNSKPERIIVTEMFHVKALKQLYQKTNCEHVLVFHVSIDDDSD